jgi:hypothetical protein
VLAASHALACRRGNSRRWLTRNRADRTLGVAPRRWVGHRVQARIEGACQQVCAVVPRDSRRGLCAHDRARIEHLLRKRPGCLERLLSAKEPHDAETDIRIALLVKKNE